MKQILVISMLLYISSTTFGAITDFIMENRDGEMIFNEHVDEGLRKMEKAAAKMSVQGVAVMAFIPGDVSDSWVSKMKVFGLLHNGEGNYLAIAYSKAAEMADTFKDSGSGVREPLKGEFGWQGGIIRKVESGYLLAVFSGASGEQDVEIAKEGIESLTTFF